MQAEPGYICAWLGFFFGAAGSGVGAGAGVWLGSGIYWHWFTDWWFHWRFMCVSLQTKKSFFLPTGLFLIPPPIGTVGGGAGLDCVLRCSRLACTAFSIALKSREVSGGITFIL